MSPSSTAVASRPTSSRSCGDRGNGARSLPHVRSALTASSVTIPLEDGELALGELQAIFFCEFDGPRERKIHVAVT
jgi:thiamine phosphate synthase YjbQ (UPF0047 family)